MNIQLYKCTLKPVIRGHHWDKDKVVFTVVRFLRSIWNEDTNQFPLYISQSYFAGKGSCNCTDKASTLTTCKLEAQSTEPVSLT